MKAKDFRQQAWAALSGKWNNFIIITLIYFAICGILTATCVGSIAVIVVGGPLIVAISGVALKALKGEPYEVKNMFDGFSNFTNTFLLYILNGVFIALWSLLFYIPGIVKSLSYSMSYFIMAEDPNITQAEARKLSMQMMNGNKWRLFCLQFSFIGWCFLGAFTFGILYLWIIPYMQTATAAFYEDLKTRPIVTE